MQSYRDLVAWQKAMDLVVVAYQLAKQFPKEELYGLTSQLQRAVVSIPSNIAMAENQKLIMGATFRSRMALYSRAKRRFSIRLAFISEQQNKPFLLLSAEVGRLLNGLRRSLEQ